MPRDILEAAQHIANMNQDEVELFARHDPDIFRDVAKSLVRFDKEIDVIVIGEGSTVYLSRISVKNLAQRLHVALVDQYD